MVHAERVVAHRLDPPGIDAGGEGRRRRQVRVKGCLIDDLAAGKIDEDGIRFHQGQFAGADHPVAFRRQRQAQHQHIRSTEQRIEIAHAADPFDGLIRRAAAVDGVHLQAERPHQAGGGDADAAEPQNAANGAGQHAVGAELVELAAGQITVLDEQALGRRVGHGDRVLGHRLGVGAAVAGDRHMRGQRT